LRVVIAPDSFKDCLAAADVANAIAAGVRRADPSAFIDLIPMADGGQGTVDAVLACVPGSRVAVDVVGPLGMPVSATLAIIDNGRSALFEMASASGLELVPVDQRNPLFATTLGTGQLLRAALDLGVDRILIGIGGSATNDGGAGMAQAIGYRLLDSAGRDIPPGADPLDQLTRIEVDHAHQRLAHVRIDVACDVTNPLTGPEGASAVYGPQKGATPDIVEKLDGRLKHLAAIVRRDLGREMDGLGSGAAGGLGGGLRAFAHAQLQRGIDVVAGAVCLDERLAGADLCITGEGSLDEQSAFGKTAVGVARRARALGVPTVALTGALGRRLAPLHDAGLVAYFDIIPRPTDLADALAQAADNLTLSAEQVVRLFLAARLQHPG
jgi:glycerate kinase